MPPQSPKHIVERESITAIRRSPQEILRNKAFALTRRERSVAKEDSEVSNLFTQLDPAEYKKIKLSLAQCEAIFKEVKEVTSDYSSGEGPIPQSSLNP
jgi:hypothetical protein